ncbi:unnamed protein product [Schistosoma rodhaini]|uniref:G-protein coupled receptors family 1 profile domain-containing protein n=1 Tax=Schistosoma rodhaini TaxID=6188 RepID=A0AA85F5I3_9TREM|nr:unnamed protein product [Schistosoma rodhaini]
MNLNIKDLIMNSIISNETWNSSIWNQSQILSSLSSSSPPLLSPSSFLVVTQVDVTDLQVYVILKHYLPIPIFIVSILCILVTLIAVTQRGLWRTTVTYIIVLAIVDLFTLISLCILSMDFFIIPALPEGLFTRVYFLIETILGELVDTLLLISNWLTVLIATERYLAVCHPLKVRFIDCKYRRIFIILVILSSILIKLPGFIILGYAKEINSSYTIIIFRKIYIWIVQILLFLIIPFSILTFVNIRLIQTVRNSLQLINQRCKKINKESILSSSSNQSDPGIIRRMTSCYPCLSCCISSNSNKIYSFHQCSDSLLKIVCCDCFNLSTKPVNNCQLQHNQQQQQQQQQLNESKRIFKKNELIQMNDSSPVTSPTSLTASEPTGAQLGRTQREEKKITITLICLIVTFFICQGPFVLTTVIMRFSSTGFYLSDTNKIINNTLLLCNTFTDQNHIETITPNKPFGFVDYINPISVIALALKSDLSFFFYCWFCDRFLLALKKITRHKCWPKLKRHNFYNFHHHRHRHLHSHHHHHHHHCYQKCSSHPHLQKLTKSHQIEQKNNIELNMPSSGSLPAEYRLPHHHYKDGGEYYQYRIPVDMVTNQHKIITYKKPAPLPFNLSKHNKMKKKSVISLPMNVKISWSSPSCSDNSYKCSSSPKKKCTSSVGCSKK